MKAPEPYAVVARNIDPAADNRIHDDDVARRLGFEGALVPGVELFAYATSPLVARWGREWLSGGALALRFRRPVYDGERIVVRTEPDGGAWPVTVSGPDGSVRATGSAHPPAGPFCVDVHRYVDSPLPSAPRPARPAALPDGPLGSVTQLVTATDNSAYCAAVDEPLGLYREGVVHPGLLLRLVNTALMRNVELGPWIHTSSRCRLLAVASVSAPLTVHSVVTGRSARSGNEYVHYDALVLCGAVPVLVAAHSAIYSLAG